MSPTLFSTCLENNHNSPFNYLTWENFTCKNDVWLFLSFCTCSNILWSGGCDIRNSHDDSISSYESPFLFFWCGIIVVRDILNFGCCSQIGPLLFCFLSFERVSSALKLIKLEFHWFTFCLWQATAMNFFPDEPNPVLVFSSSQ